MSKIHVLLTYDYELPLGGVYGTFAESLFDPTEELLKLAKELNVPLNFFADVLSYEKFLSLNRKDFTEPFAKQLLLSHNNGHDVQLHLHPHWIDTKVEGNKFFPSDKYALDSFKNEEGTNSIDSIVKRGIEVLKEILKESTVLHQCVAYRGGGYVLSPATSQVLGALRNNGIKIDSSISRGYFFKSNLSKVDYTKVPFKPNWFLSMNGAFDQEEKEGVQNTIYEIPIASKPKKLLEVPTAFKMKKYAHRAPVNRGYMIHQKAASFTLQEKIKQVLSYRMLSFDNYTYSKEYLVSIFDTYVQTQKTGKDMYLSVVSHPKSMGPYSFELMRYFVEYVREKYGDEVVFTTFKKSAEDLHL